MTQPIAQTFYINEPIGGVEGIILTSVDIYFQSVSPTYGVELRICTTQNGEPTPYMLPEASKVLQVTDTYGNSTPIIRSSTNASIPTRFTFDSPITLQTQTSYALVIVPIGGNPDYTIWTGAIGGSDVTTSTPIYQSTTAAGTLYLSTNDINFTPVISEAIKYTLYTADFTTSGGAGSAVYTIANNEQLVVSTMSGSFIPNEFVYLSNTFYYQAALTISSNTGAFTSGEFIYQSNGSANVATGYLLYADTSKILVSGSNGAWTSSYQVKGNTSGSNGVITAVSQNVVTYSNSTISVPYTSNGTANIFYSNQTIFVGTSSSSVMEPHIVTGTINSTAISVNSSFNVSFSDTNALFGQVRGDGLSLYARYSGISTQTSTNIPVNLWSSSSNTTVNFSNSVGQYIMGYSSKSSARVRYSSDSSYDGIIPQISQNTPQSANIQWSMTGINIANTYDSSSVPLTDYIVKEFTDATRSIKSRSTELTKYSGNNTITITGAFTTSNNKISPYIDNMDNNITLVNNILFSNANISGYAMARANSNGILIKNAQITQINGSATVTGTIFGTSPNYIYVSNTSGAFTSGYTIYLSSDSTINTYITSSTEINEKYSSNVFSSQSRYISKSVVLAAGQDAEDLVLYMGAYRPSNTNFQVYGQLLNAQDTDPLNAKIYSRLIESSNSAVLTSSPTNPNDIVELVYNLPISTLVYSNTIVSNNTTANVTFNTPYTTTVFSNNQFIYLNNANTGAFNVRQIVSITNSTSMVLSSAPTVVGNSSTAYADIGIIPGLEHTSAGFRYATNLSIARYVSNTDIVYDSFLTFAIKIVPTSDNSYVAPRATDMRALALQV